MSLACNSLHVHVQDTPVSSEEETVSTWPLKGQGSAFLRDGLMVYLDLCVSLVDALLVVLPLQMTQSQWAAVLPAWSWTERELASMVTSNTGYMHLRSPGWWGEKTATSTTWLYGGKISTKTAAGQCPHVLVLLNYERLEDVVLPIWCCSGLPLLGDETHCGWYSASSRASVSAGNYLLRYDLSFNLAFMSSGTPFRFFLTVPHAPNPKLKCSANTEGFKMPRPKQLRKWKAEQQQKALRYPGQSSSATVGFSAAKGSRSQGRQKTGRN